MLVFRRNGATYGVGDPIYNNKNALEVSCRKNAFLLKDDGITSDFMNQVRESAIGSPRVCDENLYGLEVSPNYFKNLRNAYRIYKHLLPVYGNKAISICEIGAGYGMLATMLFKLFNVKNYTVIDLPQNLHLSSFYISANYPDKSIKFINYDVKSVEELRDLNFVLAGDVDKIGCKYDLIINTDSFGEMPAATARYYVDRAKERLDEGGIFHSDNRIRVPGNKGPQDFSGLGYLTDYKFFHLDGTRTQAEIFNQPHHILFLEKRKGVVYPNDFWNAMAFLYSAGLAESIQLYINNGSGSLSEEAIQLIIELFTAKNKSKITSLMGGIQKQTRRYPFFEYLLFLVKFASGSKSDDYLDNLIGYIDQAKREPANVLSIIIYLSLINSERIPKNFIFNYFDLKGSFLQNYPHLTEDFELLIDKPSTSLRSIRAYAVETILGVKIKNSIFHRIKKRVHRRISCDFLLA